MADANGPAWAGWMPAVGARIAHALNLKDDRGATIVLSAPLRDRSSESQSFDRFARALEDVRASATGPSVADLLGSLAARQAEPSRWPRSATPTAFRDGRRALVRDLHELERVLAIASFSRSKRAERARLLPELLLLFALDRFVPSTDNDEPDVDRRVRDLRRALDAMTR